MSSRSVVRTINELAFTHYVARRNWRANGRIWLWYWDGTNIVHQSRPTGGGSWTSPEAVRACDDRLNFATWFDGTYFHYAYSQGNVNTPDSTIFYRRGLANGDGSITWSAAEQTVQDHTNTYRHRNLSICVDDGGYPWVAWQRAIRTSSGNSFPYVSTSSTNDGTWVTAAGYRYNPINVGVTWYMSLVPMTSGQVMMIYGGNYRLYERVLTAVSKGSQVVISGYQANNRQLRHNAVAIGDIVYLCYQYGTAGGIRFQVYNGSWGAVSTPATPPDRPGLLAKLRDDSILMLFWENAANVILYKRYLISGGSWGNEETFLDESGDTIPAFSVMQASYDGEEYPFLHYATKAGAPYDMIFAEWEPPYVDLPAKFFVKQWQEDLPASFHVGQDSAELLGNVGIRHAGTPIELLGNAVIRHVGTPVELLGNTIIKGLSSAELLGEVDVGQDSAELLGNAVIRHPGSAELLGKFEAQATAELLGNAEIRQSGPKPWIVGWNLRKSHTLTGSVAGAQTDYQVGIKVYYGSGIDGTETIGGATFGKVYCDSKCRVDFGDIRFTESDETSLLNYWIEEQVDSDYAIIWVEVDSIPASPGTTDIYIYYGNVGASTTSNGDNTFLIFNDCATTTGWSVQTITGSPAWGTAIMDGATTIYIEANNHNEKLRIQYDTILSTGRENRRALTRVKHTSWNQDGYFNWYTPLILSPSTQYDALRYSSYYDYYTIYASVGGVSDTTNYNAGHPSGWYRYEKKTNAAGAVTGYRDDTELGTATVDGDYSGGKVMYYVNEWNPGLTKHYIDWFAIGKYVDPEPTHITWGPETTATAVGGVLPAQFEVGQDSAELLGKFDVGQDSAELLGRFEAQATAELLGNAIIRQAGSQVELLGNFEVGQGSAELLAWFLIPRAYNFSSGMGISFDWWGSGGVDQQIDFEMWSLMGGWVGRFPDGPAEWRQVLITWDDLTEVDLDGTRPDSSQIIGIYWTYHTPGVRRIDGIRAWMRQDLLCKVVIRNASASDLLSKFEAQASQDLLGKFVIQQYFNDLKAVFHVDMSVLGPVWDYQYVWQNVAAELEVGMQQGQIEIDPVTSAITARQRHAIDNRTIVTMCGGNRVYSKGTFIFDAEASAYGGANPVYTPAFGLVENKWDWFAGASVHAAMVYSNGAGAWYFVTEDDGTTESTLIAGIDFTAQHTFKIIWEDASEFPATGRVRFYIDDVLKATHIIAVPTHPLQFFLTMDSYIVASSESTEYTKVHTFSATGYV